MKRDVIPAHCPVVARLGAIAVHRIIHEPAVWGVPVATYMLTDGKTWIAVDCGWPGEQGIPLWERAIGELGLDWHGLEHILVTHSHADHVGLAQAMSERSGRPVSIHPDALAEVAFYKQTGPERDAAFTQFLVRAGQRRLESSEPPPNPYVSLSKILLPSHVENLVPGASVSIGDCQMNVLLTPGHGRGHVCLVDSERRLAFGGDMLLPDMIPNVVVMPGTTVNPLGEYLESLRRLEECGVKLILPSHGEPMAEPISRFDGIRAYHARQLAWIRDGLALGRSTAAELAVNQTFHGRRFEDLSDLAQVVVLGETLAYLQLLVAEGSVSSVTVPEQGTQRFALR